MSGNSNYISIKQAVINDMMEGSNGNVEETAFSAKIFSVVGRVMKILGACLTGTGLIGAILCTRIPSYAAYERSMAGAGLFGMLAGLFGAVLEHETLDVCKAADLILEERGAESKRRKDCSAALKEAKKELMDKTTPKDTRMDEIKQLDQLSSTLLKENMNINDFKHALEEAVQTLKQEREHRKEQMKSPEWLRDDAVSYKATHNWSTKDFEKDSDSVAEADEVLAEPSPIAKGEDNERFRKVMSK